MRSLRSFAAIIFLAVFSSVALADDVITNVMSPIVSYQFPDDFNTQALTNGGISSPIISYQYFEWPGDDVLQLLSSPQVSYFYQIGSGTLPLVLHGRVTDTLGAGIPNATISATVGMTPAAQASVDASGNYVLPPLGAGIYALTARASGYGESPRVITLNGGTSPQHFQLAALPAGPGQTPVTRSPEVNHTAGPMGELKVFDGSNFVAISEANKPQSDRMTIVMTHGFASNPEAWARELAEKMWAQGVTPGVANILCWDWHEAARGPLIPPSRLALAHGSTGEQGIGLGQALQDKLGGGYAKEIHFLGHSLGTLVNAATANYLQGTATARQAVSPTPWMNAPMHMTLFDHAELATLANLGVLFDGITVTPSSSVNKLYQAAAATLQAWSSPVPRRFSWLDNYVSLVGFYVPSGVNIALPKGVSEILPDRVHRYPAYWYGLSVTNPAASVMGHRRSHEYDLVRGGSFTFPPAESEIPSGASYRQVPAASDPLALELLLPGNSFEHFGILPQVAVQATVSSIKFAGDVAVEVRETTEAAALRLASGFNYAAGVALQGGQMVMDLSASPVVRLWLRTQGIPLPSPLSLRNGTVAFNPASASAPQPMAWLPIAFPANATAMAFDFRVEGDPVDDALVCGIGTNNLFSLEAKYIPTNTMSASRLIDVSAWAGTTNELFFGFLGGTSTNAALVIENIRFYSVEAPRLEIARDGDASHLSWSSTAGGYVVETTPTLAAPAWEAMTNAPMILGDRYVLAGSSSDQTRFYRLRAR